MGRFSQEGRPFRVDTPLEPDTLLLQRYHGDEGVSIPFHYTLELLSEEEAVDPEELLRQPMVVTVRLQDDAERKVHGLVRRFTQMGQRDDLTLYSAEIVPWLWFLTLSRDCKVFQNKSVLDIVQEVFDGLGWSDYDIRCSQTYAPREYCVQYRETHFNFVSRLLEEEGIFYFFEHTEDGHTLVLADMNGTCEACPDQDTARMATDEGPWQDEDVVTSLSFETAVHLTKVTLREYDFTRPSLNLETSAEADDVDDEAYDYPGLYKELDDGTRYAQLLLEEGSCGGQVIRGASNCRAFQSGFKTTLSEHYRPDANQEYLLLHVSHRGEAGDYRSWDTAQAEYRNTFVCIPSGTPYRPPRRSRKPTVHGSQTAVVVGPSGEEVYTDQYGRIKIQFYWDRLGQRDQNSSCWVRVSFPWAGKRYGAVSIPRIGNEVIIDFLEGDPDQPIVTGSVYNAEMMPPFELPSNAVQQGMKTRTSPGGAGDNEISMTDTSGEELVHIHAQKDMTTAVGNDQSTTVGHDQSTTVENDQSATVSKGNRTVTVSEGTITETAKKAIAVTSQTEDVSITAETFFYSGVASGKSNVQGNKDGNAQIWGQQLVTAWSDSKISVTCDSGPVEITGATEIKAKVGGYTITIDTGKIELNASGSKITMDSGKIELSAGGSKITIDSGGVSATGAAINLNS